MPLVWEVSCAGAERWCGLPPGTGVNRTGPVAYPACTGSIWNRVRGTAVHTEAVPGLCVLCEQACLGRRAGGLRRMSADNASAECRGRRPRRDLARPQRRIKPAQTARPMAAEQTAGVWTPAALRDRLHAGYRLDFGNDVWGDCGGGRLRARKAGYGVADPILPFAGALRARAARRSKRARAGPLRGQRLQGCEVNERARSAHLAA